MVNDVKINDTVEHLATDEAKGPVNSGQCSVQESPSVGLVVVAIRMGVVQVSDCHWYQN